MVREAIEAGPQLRPTEVNVRLKTSQPSSKPTPIEASILVAPETPLSKKNAQEINRAIPEAQNIVIFTAEKKRSIRETLKQKAKERLLIKMEHKTKDSSIETVKPQKSFFERKFGRTLDNIASFTFLVLAGPQIMDNIEPEFLPGAKERLTEIMKDPDVVLFIHSNHQSIAEIIAKGRFAKQLTKITNEVRGKAEKFPGVALPYARSLATEDHDGQGVYAKRLAKWLKKKLAKSHNLFMEEYIREKDLKKYGISDVDKNGGSFDNNRLMLRLYRYLKRGFAIDSFSPGTVDESRFTTDENGNQHRKGFQELDFTQHLRLMEIAEKLGKKPVMLTTSLEGGHNVIDPAEGEEPRPTRKAALACLDLRNSPGIRTVLKKMHLGNKPLITMTIGMPTFKTEMMQQIKEKNNGQEIVMTDINNFVGYRIAEPLSVEAKGYYKINP